MPTSTASPKTVVMSRTGIKDARFKMHRLSLDTHLGTDLDVPYRFAESLEFAIGLCSIQMEDLPPMKAGLVHSAGIGN
jgi:kynurenine formamidase